MSGLLSIATGGFLWKAGCIAAALAAAGLGAALVVADIKGDMVAKQLKTVETSITDPTSGYQVRIAQAETNVAGLQQSVTVSNKALSDMSAADAAKLAAMTQAVAAANAATATDAAKLAVFNSKPPAGASVCDRLQSADSQVQDLMK